MTRTNPRGRPPRRTAAPVKWGWDSAPPAEHGLQAALEEKEALLYEVVHRVKNDLQLVSSLLSLQAAEAGPEAAQALLAAQARVRAMALVHQSLHERSPAGRFDMRDYVARLAQCYGGAERPARILTRVAGAKVPAEAAVPLAMIVNELVANAVKHAFPPPRQGRVVISIARRADGLRLRVLDDGIGGERPGGRGLGLKLVELWTSQLGGVLDMRRSASGTDVRVDVPA